MEGIEPLPTIPDLNENSIALNKEMFKLFDLPAGEFCDEYHEQSTLASFQGLEPHVYNPPHYFRIRTTSDGTAEPFGPSGIGLVKS